MRIMAIADDPSPRLWGSLCKEALSGIDLVLSAGDLPAAYLDFLTCFSNAPVVYIRGNHDDKYAQKPPEGCICADGAIVLVKGVRILGLGGSFRYRPDGINMYTEAEMAGRIASLRWKLRSTGGFDILLTHAPIRGLGDEDNLSHRGFECFGPLVDKYHPAVMIHGHMHQAYTPRFVRVRERNGVQVINASTCYEFDLPETPDRKEPTRRGIRYMEKAASL